MNFFDQGDLRLKGMVTEVNKSHSKFGQVLAMVGIMSIQAAKGASMVCPQFLVPDYGCGWEFDHRHVFLCPWNLDVHGSLGFQGNSELDGPVAHRQCKVGLVAVLRWLWNSFPLPFSGGVVRVWVRWLAFANRVRVRLDCDGLHSG